VDAFKPPPVERSEVLWSTTRHRQNQLLQPLRRVGADLVALTAIVWNPGIFIDADVS